jgi:hypothetical protein
MKHNLFDLSGKVALITGGNGGIGLGFAQGIAKQGGNVCIWGQNPEKNQQAFEQLQRFGTKIHAIACDVADEAAVTKAFAETLAEFGRVDACFANAGVGGGGRFSELSAEQWRRVGGESGWFVFYFAPRGPAYARACRSGRPRWSFGGNIVYWSAIGHGQR